MGIVVIYTDMHKVYVSICMCWNIETQSGLVVAQLVVYKTQGVWLDSRFLLATCRGVLRERNRNFSQNYIIKLPKCKNIKTTK